MRTLKAVNIYLPLFILLSVLLSSCSDDVITPDTRLTFDLRAWDYSDNHYFLDTIYKESFEDYYNNTTISWHTDSFAVDEQSFEVWLQTDLSTTGYRMAGLHVDLQKLPSNGNYNDSLKVVPYPQQGIRNFGLVRKLNLAEYGLNRYAGYLSLKIAIPYNYFVGVAYKRPRTGEQYGTITSDSGSLATDTLVLKMVKVQNLIPQNTLAWNLQLRNIYSLGKNNIVRSGFEFYIEYSINNVNNPNLPGISTPLIEILGLDRYTSGRTGGPNGQFDYIPGLTIDQLNGWIIFPSLEPFLTNLQNYNNNGKTIDPAYWYAEIYSNLKHQANLHPNANRYLMNGYAP